MMSKTTKRFALGTMIAGVAGYMAGILTAPKSGKQTRDEIKDAANQSMHEAEKQLKALHTELNKLLEEAKSKGSNVSDKAQTELKDLVDKAKDTKEKAREMLSALHEGGAEDKDLNKAIADAKKAVEHVKDYLKK
ncbi:MAG TPA: YtxH domain-containing protein [Candidatus Saccharimonadales bacterium]|nr:YtxH domain-containing protein [Candidatus Saccharimonadales bacterium]